jgi:hypothetical protein
MGEVTAPMQAYGVSIDVPQGWDAAISRPEPENGSRTYSWTRLSTLPLVPNVAGFGNGQVQILGPYDVFMTLVEFGYSPDAELFDAVGYPWPLQQSDFSHLTLQLGIPHQAGCQFFFTTDSLRQFSFYVVIGDEANVALVLDEINQILDSVSIEPFPDPNL